MTEQAANISRMINNLGFPYKVVAKELASEHRTLQQSFMRLCVAYIQEMATHESYDARNERSVLLAKEIVKNIPSDMLILPMV